MRLVQVTVPTGKRDAIIDILESEGVDYVLTDENSDQGYVGVVYFPLPSAAVEPVLDALHDAADLESDAYTVIIDAETVISRQFEALRERYEDGDDPSPERIARQELTARAAELLPDVTTYAVLTVVSIVVATAGVLLDSPAIVVGSMVIAPLIGPAMATSVGSVVGDRDLFIQGVRLQALGGVLAVVSAAAFALFVKTTFIVPPGTELTALGEVQERVAPGVLSLAVALGAGIAGAFSLSAAISTALVGVAIAVALVPPVAVIGVGIAWGRPEMALGATVLVLVNFLSINATAMATLWWGGYRPERFFRFEDARRSTFRRIAVLLVAIAVLAVFLGAVTHSSMQRATFDDGAREAITETLSTGEYRYLQLHEMETTYGDGLPVFPPEPQRIVVTVGRPADAAYPDLPDAIDARIRSETGYDVTVEVHFVEIEISG